MSSWSNHPTGAQTALALRPKDAAKALGLGQRKLWALTAPRGPIPCKRAGTAVLYSIVALQAWLEEQGDKGVSQ